MVNKQPRVLIFVLSILVFCLCRANANEDSTQVETSGKKTNICVLPITGSDLPKGLLEVLADDFRRSLSETGSFSVMTRELMTEILQEQNFQLTDACDQTNCIVQTGRLIGVSKIVSITLTVLQKQTFVVSAKLVDVETAEILITGSEKRTGDSYEINSRMLRNLASVLAGKPNADHQEYTYSQEQLLKDKRLLENMQTKRFKIMLAGSGDYPLHILQKDNEKPTRDFYNQNPKMLQYGVPSSRFDFTGSAVFAYRLNHTLWLEAKACFKRIPVQEMFFAGRDSTADNPWQIISSDTTSRHAVEDISSKSYTSYKTMYAGLGLKVDCLRYPKLGIGFSAVPELGTMEYYQTAYDSSFKNTNLYLNHVFVGKTLYHRELTSKSVLTSFVYGAEFSLDIDFIVHKNLSIFSTIGVNLMVASSLQGKTDYSQITVQRDFTQPDAQPVHRDTTQNAAMVKGDLLGTGEFLYIANPDEKNLDSNGNNIPFSKSFMEFSDFKITLGIGYYF